MFFLFLLSVAAAAAAYFVCLDSISSVLPLQRFFINQQINKFGGVGKKKKKERETDTQVTDDTLRLPHAS